MTTIGMESMTLRGACEAAGVGGVVTRNSVSYTVGRDIGGLTLRMGDGPNQPLHDFTQDAWTVTTRVHDEAPAQTVREFFGGLRSGTHVVRPRSADVMVWSGIYENDGTAPVLFRRDYGTYLALEMSGEPNDWVACTDGEGEPIVEGTLGQRAMRDVVRGNARHASQNAEIVKLRQDWRTLNDHLNTYADENSMCSDYERRLDTWNESFQLLELEGRKRDYTVRIRVDATYYVDVNVSASSEDAARDDAHDLDTSDLDVAWDSPDNIEHEVIDVSRA